jgi:uncharacterized membrane protein
MTDADTLVARYLGELDSALAGLPRDRRREVLEEIAAHIAEARGALDSPTEADVRNVLDRVGEPADIAADARERFGISEEAPTWREYAAVVLLPIGGVIVPVLGWLVGVVLLWSSKIWTPRDKWIGTLVIPGGLLIPFFALAFAGTTSTSVCITPTSPPGPTTCTGTGGGTGALAIATMIVLLTAPIATAIYLAYRLRRPR